MISQIYNILESFGLTAQKRAIHIQFSNPFLNTQVFLQRIDGQHTINDGLKAELICISTNAHISLKQFVGCQVAVDQVTDLGELFRTTGIITEASQGQSDGALTLYKLTLQDAMSLWHKRRNSRVFMNKSIRDITEIIFKEWQEKSPLFAASLSLDLTGLSKNYDVRPFVMQSNELDIDFLTRLWRSEGISWLIDEAQLKVPFSSAPIEAQKLKLIDDQSYYQALQRKLIRYHRTNATERFDTITSFIAQRSLQSTAIQLQRWQSDSLAQDLGESVLSTHLHSDVQENQSLSLEQAWTISPAWISDLNGDDQATASGTAQLEALNQNLTQYQELQSKYFTALSSVRDAQVGYWFEFSGHPEIDMHQGSDREFLILSKQFYNQNNLPKDLQEQVLNLLKLSRWNVYQDERQGCQLSLIRRAIRVVPEYDPLKHRPIAYPQRAKVVGPEGETIYVDQWGRIKVRFLFTRTDDHSHDGGAGSNENDTDSAWVDVLTTWAGEGYGTRFHPRIGEIVVIDFFDGNVDRPFVTGRLHEAERHQTMFDIKGQLPDTKKLSGIRSKEVEGEGFNQLRFDDTTGQISAQLQSSHAATQLNLGNLSHPKQNEISDGRGEGFELRTDAYGAVRAGKGMLITTYAQENAIAEHLESAQAQSLLAQGEESMKMLSEIAVKQQTDALNVISRLPKFIQSIGLKSQSDAINTTINLFTESLNIDPITALKGCAGFFNDLQELSPIGSNIMTELNQFVSEIPNALDNLTSYLENVQEYANEAIQGQLASLMSTQSSTATLLQDVARVLMNVDISDFDLTQSCGSFGGINNPLKIDASQILGSLAGFMEGYTQGLEKSSDKNKQAQGQIFRQALMLLASPNGIALTTPEDIILNASQDIAASAQGSINLSAQKNIVGHAQNKISLFAAQKGFSAYAAKGKLELQAQDDAIEAIARKVIKLISTEDKIEITSPKEIVLTAGGSQLKINGSGIFTKTGGKFESKAGQHSFVGGENISYNIPELPGSGPFTKVFHFISLDGNIVEEVDIEVFEKKDEMFKSKVKAKIVDAKFVLNDEENSFEYKALIGFDDWVSYIEDESEIDDDDDDLDLGEHYNPYDHN